MIRREDNEGWVLITQYDHAGLARRIMKHWGNEEFSKPDPYEEVVFAVKEHDSGWVPWDSEPKVNPSNGYPANFMEMSTNDQVEIWSRCYKPFVGDHPYAAALIALHFMKFNQKAINKNDANGLATNLQNEMADYIAGTLDIPLSGSQLLNIPSNIKANLRYLQVSDIISLTLCHGWQSIDMDQVPTGHGELTKTLQINSEDGFNFTIDPYPLDEPVVECSIVGKKISMKSFSSNDEYRSALKSAETTTLKFSMNRK